MLQRSGEIAAQQRKLRSVGAHPRPRFHATAALVCQSSVWGILHPQVSADRVEVTVQLVKADYLVVSLPRRKPGNAPTLGFLSTKVLFCTWKNQYKQQKRKRVF